MAKLKIGIIGCGGIATAAHIPNYLKIPEVEVAACCDIDYEKAKRVAERFSIPKAYRDYRDLLKQDLDAVSVCTPNFAHMEPTVAALEAGKHVLVEKPMAMNADEAETMLRAAERSGMKLMVGLNNRWRSDVQALKSFVDDGVLGEVYFSKAECLRRRGIPGWGVFTQKDKQGGGPLVDLGVHIMDLALYLMGYPEAARASGATYTKFGTRGDVVGLMGQWDPKKFTVEDFALGLVRFKNGGTMFVETSFAANIGKDSFNLALLGTQAGLTLDPPRIYGEKHMVLTDTSPAMLREVNTHEVEMRKFVECILRDEEPPVTAQEGLALQRIMDAIYRSAELGREVEIL